MAEVLIGEHVFDDSYIPQDPFQISGNPIVEEQRQETSVRQVGDQRSNGGVTNGLEANEEESPESGEPVEAVEPCPLRSNPATPQQSRARSSSASSAASTSSRNRFNSMFNALMAPIDNIAQRVQRHRRSRSNQSRASSRASSLERRSRNVLMAPINAVAEHIRNYRRAQNALRTVDPLAEHIRNYRRAQNAPRNEGYLTAQGGWMQPQRWWRQLEMRDRVHAERNGTRPEPSSQPVLQRDRVENDIYRYPSPTREEIRQHEGTLRYTDEYGHCPLCFEPKMFDAVGCMSCRKPVGCKHCIQHWSVTEERNGQKLTCPLCRAPTEKGYAHMTTMRENGLWSPSQ